MACSKLLRNSARQMAVKLTSGIEVCPDLFDSDGNAVAFFQVCIQASDPCEEIFGVRAGIKRMSGHFNKDRIAMSAERHSAGRRIVPAAATDGEPAGIVQFDWLIQH